MTPIKVMFFTLCGILCSCGIKGRPLPPENNVVNINQLPAPVEPTPAPTPAKTGKEVKKTTKKK